ASFLQVQVEFARGQHQAQMPHANLLKRLKQADKSAGGFVATEIRWVEVTIRIQGENRRTIPVRGWFQVRGGNPGKDNPIRFHSAVSQIPAAEGRLLLDRGMPDPVVTESEITAEHTIGIALVRKFAQG